MPRGESACLHLSAVWNVCVLTLGVKHVHRALSSTLLSYYTHAAVFDAEHVFFLIVCYAPTTYSFHRQVKVQANEGGGRGGVEGKSKGWRSGADMAVSPERDAGEGGRQRVASQRRGYR